jgi:hypothetical protein
MRQTNANCLEWIYFLFPTFLVFAIITNSNCLDPNRTWAHLLISIAITTICLYTLLIRTNEYNELRETFLYQSEADTLLLEGLSESQSTEKAVRSLFAPHAGIVSVHFYHNGNLAKRILKRAELVKKIEGI